MSSQIITIIADIITNSSAQKNINYDQMSFQNLYDFLSVVQYKGIHIFFSALQKKVIQV